MKALELLKIIYKDCKDWEDKGFAVTCPTNELSESIKELEFYLSKRNNYPPCDACGKEVDYMPWHYSTEKERHLHSCDECWESIKDKFTLKG